ncbi:MAG: hypothetical protein RR769_08020 [Anaerovoracaceae bacterium]
MQENQQDKLYALTYKNVVAITVYYILLLVLAIVCTAGTIYIEYTHYFQIEQIPLAILGCSFSSLLGSLVYYIRKVYLTSIHNKIKKDDEYTLLEKWGTIIYFVVRPIFSVIISAIVIMGFATGVFAFFITDGTLSNTFVDFTIVVSFFLGISNGTLIDNLDKVGNGFIRKIFD